MKSHRCPYHVKQGIVGENNELILSDICAVKSSCGAACRFAESDGTFQQCDIFKAQQKSRERHILSTKADLDGIGENLVSNKAQGEFDII